ncbi:ATP-binding protein [Congregibacter brevis]|uniref:histidine kinase n=1 Tax=Congregibacter brevis TaxID=3081201 RepID=A0ABZ0II32_9GAMM|nr:ATP-binding protein [Congregibacter sp. IMCC45268]
MSENAEPKSLLTTARDDAVDKILVEQVKTLYDSIASLVLINSVVSVALVYAFWLVVPQSQLLIWLGLVFLMLGARVAVYRSFRRDFHEKNLSRYKMFLVLGSASAGVVWGIGGLIMFAPGQFEYQLLILLSLLAMAAGSAFSLSIYMPAYFAFVPTMLLPITVEMFWLGQSVYFALGMVTIVFSLAQTAFNLKINKSLTGAMALRFENLELIDELQTKHLEAEEANRAKSTFLAAASHDLRQPLYALTLFTSALKEEDNSQATNEIAGQIDRSVSALQSLFDALLDISKMDAGYSDLKKTTIPLAPVFENLAHEFDPIAREKGLDVQWPDATCCVLSERNLLEQVLRNYLSNAVRYTNQGGITVSCDIGPEEVKVSVKDTGLGIALESQGAIFNEFYQIDNPERDRKKGLGLGLSIVKRAGKLLGHEISVDSLPGEGSTFSIVLDRVYESSGEGSTTSEEQSVAEVLDQPLVIVIDDEESIREGLEYLLRSWGCEVISVADDADAIRQLDAFERIPNAIISDYRLRDQRTGVEAIESINAACGTKIPALIITGDTENDALMKNTSSDWGLLYKPVAPAKLRAFLRSSAARSDLS